MVLLPRQKYTGKTFKAFFIPFATYFPDIAQDLAHEIHSFRGVIAKIDYLRHIYASRTHPWPILIEYVMGIVSYSVLEGF